MSSLTPLYLYSLENKSVPFLDHEPVHQIVASFCNEWAEVEMQEYFHEKVRPCIDQVLHRHSRIGTEMT